MRATIRLRYSWFGRPGKEYVHDGVESIVTGDSFVRLLDVDRDTVALYNRHDVVYAWLGRTGA